MSKQWQGDLPKTCNLCNEKLVDTFIDGRTQFGPWAIMCQSCHLEHGVGLGLGRGQVYSVDKGDA